MIPPDRGLERLLLQLQRMPARKREQVLERLAPAQRARIGRMLHPQDPEETLSLGVAELVETLRDGTASMVTHMAREALLAAASSIDEKGSARRSDSLSPSLASRLGTVLAGHRA